MSKHKTSITQKQQDDIEEPEREKRRRRAVSMYHYRRIGKFIFNDNPKIENGDGSIIYKEVLYFTEEFFDTMSIICDIYNTSIRSYIEKAAMERVQSDLEDWDTLGQSLTIT